MCFKKTNANNCLFYGNETSSKIILKDLSPLMVFELEQRIQNIRTEDLIYSKTKHRLQQNINGPSILFYWLRNNTYTIIEKIWRHIKVVYLLIYCLILMGY